MIVLVISVTFQLQSYELASEIQNLFEFFRTDGAARAIKFVCLGRWLKKKLNTEGIQLVSVTHDFKFQAPDGKQRAADALDAECVQTVAIRVVTEVDDVNESNFEIYVFRTLGVLNCY